MKFLGFKCVGDSKGYYVDGHEREDVVAYRGQFLNAMVDIEKRQGEWEGQGMEEFVPPTLNAGEKKVVFIVHDESIIYSNDAKTMT